MNFLTIEEAEDRLNSKSNDRLERVLRPKRENRGRPVGQGNHSNSGRKPGDTDLPEYLRELLATTAKISGTTAAAKAFGVSTVTANHAKHGVRSARTNSDGLRNVIVDKDLKARTTRRMLNIAELAATIIEGNLPRLSEELDAVVDKPKERASILKDVAIIAEKANPKQDAPQGTNVSFHFFKPEEKDFDNAPIIDVTPIKVS